MVEPDDIRTIETRHGPARAHLYAAASPRALMVLGHGAGGGITAPDLQLAAKVAVANNVTTTLIEQPYRVAGRKAPAPAKQVDAAFIDICTELSIEGLPLITGGRSFGARVACRTVADVGAIGVLCLAFPVHPPGRPERTRQPGASAVTVPTLVVQGRSDPFGTPQGSATTEILFVDGDHGLKKDQALIRETIATWLNQTLFAKKSRS